MNGSSKVPAKFESIIIIPSGVMNFQSRKLRKKFYTYAHTPYTYIQYTQTHLGRSLFALVGAGKYVERLPGANR
jgi:hypothetical protein